MMGAIHGVLLKGTKVVEKRKVLSLSAETKDGPSMIVNIIVIGQSNKFGLAWFYGVR
ncbi:hypothetical protein AXF42_Ash019383 [Apostasia shenzhenica]|uniref:Uncharacterized protein n=1 Tax=Apostasia shenzhenica TaxID=1088818 RepID=A0A2H9ZTM5_9ASPA|nr:hypothetical protein AXF42_Ash019383 [Apostasia shenzhenica]